MSRTAVKRAPDLLVPVDGSAASARAVKHAVGRARAGGMVLHVLYVESPLMAGEVSALVTHEMAIAYRQRESSRVLKLACAPLKRARVIHEVHCVSGPVAKTIARYARSLGCSEIVMATRGMGNVKNLLLGSVATEVVRLASVPVTLVK